MRPGWYDYPHTPDGIGLAVYNLAMSYAAGTFPDDGGGCRDLLMDALVCAIVGAIYRCGNYGAGLEKAILKVQEQIAREARMNPDGRIFDTRDPHFFVPFGHRELDFTPSRPLQKKPKRARP